MRLVLRSKSGHLSRIKKKKKELNTVALTDTIYEKVRSSFFPAAVRFDRTMFYGLTVFVGSVEHSFFFVQFRLTNRVVRFDRRVTK